MNSSENLNTPDDKPIAGLNSGYHISNYNYELPDRLIAQYPLEQRDASKLLLVENPLQHRSFADIVNVIHETDLVVFNDTQVLKARLYGQKQTGGKVEVFVIKITGQEATAFIKASKAPKSGSIIDLLRNDQMETLSGHQVQVLSQNPDGTYQIVYPSAWLDLFKICGHLPLPPYMNRAAKQSDDERYQTLWAAKPGAVAAPTASLHFSHDILNALKAKHVSLGYLTLHVGAGTFAPVRVDDIREHQMHEEFYDVSDELIAQIKMTRQKGGRIFAVGTTVLRTLETIIREKSLDQLESVSGNTAIFIYPGFEFKLVDHLITNFHLPKSTLLMLVSAFAGQDEIKQAYTTAIEHEYRFFSYGDAMLLTRKSTRDMK